jgi:hypothetical protein
MQRVIRVPPVLITPEILSTTPAFASPPICPTSHVVLQDSCNLVKFLQDSCVQESSDQISCSKPIRL